MCGRFVHQNDPKTINEWLESVLDRDFNDMFEVQSWNIAPKQQLLAVANQNPPGLNKYTFGFTPVFNKKAIWFNTRDDKLLSGKGYWQRFRNNRCIILANGFYEWQGDKAPKQPMYIQVKEEETFAFAGLWSSYEQEGKETRMATIITTEPNKFMAPIHNRMPVILSNKDVKKWVSEEKMELEEIGSFLKSFPASKMKAHLVSTTVNSYRNNGEELIKKLG